VGRPRSGGIEQAERIAERLEMSFHFHAALTRSGEKYGNAILSRYPLKVIRMGGLPRLKARRIFEPRGALWVEVDVDGIRVNVINTHLSLWPAERLLQTGALLGPDWTGNTACEAPVILCGDFNANPGSGVCKLLGTRFRDAQQVLESHKPRGTWFAGLPFSRIDHFFVSPEVEVMKIEVPATELERTSSDHLPLLVEFQMDPNRTLKNIRGELQQAAVRVPEEEGRDAVL